MKTAEVLCISAMAAKYSLPWAAPAKYARRMSHRSAVVDGPSIEDDAVVLRVVVEHPEAEDSGVVFVCRVRSFDDMTVEAFPLGQTPTLEGDYRAEAARTAQSFIDDNVDEFERLFEELGRRA
ncbi:MAG TPA: hypothetical protein VL137_03420 [Polyangiaceae bacterium]|nr:hypothetical protein [Polyangiaceae bacterium]